MVGVTATAASLDFTLTRTALVKIDAHPPVSSFCIYSKQSAAGVSANLKAFLSPGGLSARGPYRAANVDDVIVCSW